MTDLPPLRFIFEGDRTGIERDFEIIRREGLNAAQQVTDALSQIGINFNTSESNQAVDDLVARLVAAKGELESDPAIAAQYQREAAILQEQLRFKRELAQIDTFSPQDAAQARAIATELNSLNLQRINSQFDRLQEEIRESSKEATKLDGVFQGVLQGIGQQLAGLGFEAIARLGEALADQARQFLEAGVQAEQLKVSLEVLTGSAEAGQEALNNLVQFASTTPFELPEVQNAGRSLLAFGVEAEELTETLRRIGDVAAGVGAPLGELAEIYGKAKTQGRLFAEDINQLTGRGIPIIQELADQFGVSESEVKKLVESGKVGFDQLEQAFVSLTSEGGRFFDLMRRQSETVGGALSNLADKFTQARVSAFDAFNPALASTIDFISKAIESAGSNVTQLDDLAQAAENFGDSLTKATALQESLSEAIARIADAGLEVVVSLLERLTEFLADDQAVGEFSKKLEDLATNLSLALRVLGKLVEGLGALADLPSTPILIPFQGLIEKVEETGFSFSKARLAAFDFATGAKDAAQAAASAFGVVADKGFGNIGDFASGFVPEIPAPDTSPAEEAVTKTADEIIKEFERAADGAIAAFERRQTEQETAIRRLQVDQVLSEEEAQAAIAELQRSGLEEQTRLVEEQISQVQDLRERGVLSEEAAQDKLIDLEQQRADLALESVEAQIEEQERLREIELDRLEESLDLQKAIADQSVGQLELQSGQLDRQLTITQLQNDLIGNQLQLREQILQNQLDQAEASGQTAEAEQLRGDILALQREGVQAEFAAREEVLEIQQKQAELDLQRQEILAEIATLEAQVAIERAQLEGASQSEIEALSRILELRQQQQASLAGQRQQQEQINQLQEANLEVQRAIAQAQQDQAEAASQRQQAEEAATSAQAQREEQGRTVGVIGAIGEDIPRLAQARRDVSSLNGLSDVLTQSITGNRFFEQVLAVRGQTDALNLLSLSRSDPGQARAIASDIDLARTKGDSETLNKLLTKLEQLANSPKVININTPDPVGDVGRVVGNLQKAEAGGLGL
jgi:tape measure domain-containing protein